jgi:hypothetical protein
MGTLSRAPGIYWRERDMAVAIDMTAKIPETWRADCGSFRKAMEETGTEREDIWGPIAVANWRETPCVRGRAATEDDANAGRAVFYLDLSEGQKSHPIDLDLPPLRHPT